MKGRIILLSITMIILVFGSIFVSASVDDLSKKNIEREFSRGAQNVSVILNQKQAQRYSILSSDKRSTQTYQEEISFSDYEKLRGDPSVIIEYNFPIKKLLQQSTPLINATVSWNLEVLRLNLTGQNQAVCILDTGINYSHSDFGSCSAVGVGDGCRVIAGYDFGNADADPADYHGHGTHVAGIVGANGRIFGVAPNTSIVAIKVFSDADVGREQDLIDGINWCVANSSIYNITVISISLGLTDVDGNSILYEDYCDDVSSFSSLKESINSAVAKNISVIVASGNDANYTALGVPACLQNATPAGDTYDANVEEAGWGSPLVCIDATTTADKIVCHSNRNSLLSLFAPGALINSTWVNGDYYVAGGTSMATPHVAGAIAIIRQYLGSIGQTKTPTEIEDILNRTGKQIYDSYADRYFSRIDVYSALMNIDATAPNVTVSSPGNNSVSVNQNQTFICNTTDWQLNNVTLYVWNSTGLNYTETKNISGTSNSTEFNVTDLSFDSYEWNCLASDENGNSNFSVYNFSLTIGGVSLSIFEPANGTYTNANETYFNCSATTSQDRQIQNMTFYIFENENLANSSSINLIGETNSSLFSFNFTNETNYTWMCEVYSNESDYDSENYTITYDITYPNITFTDEVVTTSQAILSWNTSEAANYSFNLNEENYTNSSFNLSYGLTVTGLSASTTYSYNLTYCDRANNCNVSQEIFITSANPVVSSSSSSGGGGGGGGGAPSTLSEEKLSDGYNKKYFVGSSVSFKINNESHSLRLNKIVNNSANITIRSDPVNLLLSIGEEKKINLSSEYYYELYIKLENISYNSANITIRRINELIRPYTLIKYNQTNETDEERKYEIFIDEKNPAQNRTLPITLSILLILVIIISHIVEFILKRRKIKIKKK